MIFESLSTAYPDNIVYNDKSEASKETISLPDDILEAPIPPYHDSSKVGLGFSQNQNHCESGNPRKGNPFEDRSFHFCYDDSTSLYGVFYGRKEAEADNLVLPQLAAEISLSQLNGSYCQLSAGTSAVVVLIHCKRLHIANDRELLNNSNSHEVLRAIQLRIDHDLRIEDEFLRLYHLGLYMEFIERVKAWLAPFPSIYSRCPWRVQKRKMEFDDLCRFFSTFEIPGLHEISGGRAGFTRLLFFAVFEETRVKVTTEWKQEDFNIIIKFSNYILTRPQRQIQRLNLPVINTSKDDEKKGKKKKKIPWKKHLQKLNFDCIFGAVRRFTDKRY